MNAPSRLDDLLDRLEASGPVGRAALDYLADHRVRVSLHPQSTGARWTAFGHIELNPTQLADEAYTLSLIVHEVRHLQQGWHLALSVQGELEGWQVQYAFLRSLTGRYHSNPKTKALLAELMSLSLTDRAALRRARQLMREFAGRKYLIHLLPLYPLAREIWFWLSGGR